MPRLNLPHVPQHVVQRGNNRQDCFFNRTDYTVYLDKLHHYAQVFEVEVHAFVLMTNHVHLLVTPRKADSVSKLMQGIGRYYVRFINQTYDRTGSLWEGRYKSSIIDSAQYALTVSHYIELNPVRAGMVSHPAEYTWSSYHSNGCGKNIQLLTPHSSYLALGESSQQRQHAYVASLMSRFDEDTLEKIRRAINSSKALGDGQFKHHIGLKLDRDLHDKKRGGDRRSAQFKNQRGQSNLI